jgi:hypothetical protein
MDEQAWLLVGAGVIASVFGLAAILFVVRLIRHAKQATNHAAEFVELVMEQESEKPRQRPPNAP